MADELGNAARSVSEIKNEVMEIKNLLSEMNYNSEIEKANDGMHQMIGTMANVVSLVNGGVEAYNTYKQAATGAAGAQGLLNTTMSAGTFGLVVAGVAAAGAAVYGLCKVIDAETEAEKAHREEFEKQQKIIEENITAIERAEEARKKSVSADVSAIKYTQDLSDELKNLVDFEGKVKEGYENRVSFILNELNNAYGTEYKLVDGQIQKYGELVQTIDDVIAKEKASVYMEDFQKANEEAIRKIGEQKKEVETQSVKLMNANKTLMDARQKLSDFNKEHEGEALNLFEIFEQQNLMVAVESAEASVKDWESSYKQADALYQGLIEDQKIYGDAYALYQEENFGELEELWKEHNGMLTTYTGNNDEVLKQNVINTGSHLFALLREVQNGTKSINDIVGSDALDDFNQAVGEWEKTGAKLPEGLINSLNLNADGLSIKVDELVSGLGIWLAEGINENENSEKVGQAFNTLLQSGSTAFSDSKPEWKMAANNAVAGVVEGLESEETKNDVYNASYDLGQYSVMAYNAGQDASSPAKEFIKASENSIAGIVKGVEDNKSEVKKVFEELAEETAKASFERKLQFAKTGEEIWKLKQQEVNGLLESEKEYLAEKRRIELEQEEQEYREKLENAKNAEARQKIIAERQKELKRQEQDAYLEILKEGAEEQKKILDACQKEAEEKKEQFIDDLEEIKDAQKDFYNDLDAGGLLETVTTTLGGDEYEVEGLRDWELENKALKNYKELLDKVSGRLKEGFGEDTQGYDEFMDELRKNHKGDGGKFLAYLDMADDSELFRYISGYQENKKLREGISKDSFSEETSQLIDEFKKEWGKVPEEFFNIGDESAKNYGEGFRNSLYDILEEAISEIEYSFQSLSPTLTLVIGNGALGGGNAVTYNSTYNVIPSSGESTREQLAVIRTEETLREMRAKGGAVV